MRASMAGRRLLSIAFFALVGCTTLAAADAHSAGSGLICIAPFGKHVPTDPRDPGEANLSTATWPPTATSVFEFRLDGRKVAAVRLGEMAAVRDVPVDRQVRMAIKLDGKPFESFLVDLGAEPDQRTCLWLYPGYWRWLDGPWDEKRGCKCPSTAGPTPH